MRQRWHRLEVATRGRGLVDVTAPVRRWLAEPPLLSGLLTIWCRHTSASLLVGENTDPDVRRDLERFFARLVPDGDAHPYLHDAEGPDDMPAHIRAALTQTQISIPVRNGAAVLGTWQGFYLYEHRTAPHRRELVLHLLGEAEPETA